jgi:hypothetical protein
MNPQTLKPLKIEYTKEDGTVSERTIVSTTFVPENIKAIDVSDWPAEKVDQLITNLELYQEYKEQANKLFNFEDWQSHTKNEEPDKLKWRTFKLSRMKILD